MNDFEQMKAMLDRANLKYVASTGDWRCGAFHCQHMIDLWGGYSLSDKNICYHFDAKGQLVGYTFGG